MLKMFKSGLTKQGQKIISCSYPAHPTTKQGKTCLTEIYYQGGLKFVFSK